MGRADSADFCKTCAGGPAVRRNRITPADCPRPLKLKQPSRGLRFSHLAFGLSTEPLPACARPRPELPSVPFGLSALPRSGLWPGSCMIFHRLNSSFNPKLFQSGSLVAVDCISFETDDCGSFTISREVLAEKRPSILPHQIVVHSIRALRVSRSR